MTKGIFASSLERILYYLSQTADVGQGDPADIRERFEQLRSYGRLPQGRAQRAARLTSFQIADAVMGLTPTRPSWAGHCATVLAGFQPVGGPSASFEGATGLREALAKLIDLKEARSRLVSVSLSMAEAGYNSRGSADLLVHEDGLTRLVRFVSSMATSLLQPGAESHYEPTSRLTGMSRALVLPRAFFDELATRIASVADLTEPEGDGSEYDTDDARRERMKSLGVRPGSHFLNIGIDTQAPWPKEEMIVHFDKHTLVLMPNTKENTTSIHIDLHANKVTDEGAITIINRFLSVSAWCSDQFAILQDGWSGNSIPVPVSRRNLAFVTASQWMFDRRIPTTDEGRRALAHYREALNAQEASLVTYAVLSYFKVLELRYEGKADIIPWLTSQIGPVLANAHTDSAIAEFEKDRGTTSPAEYLWRSCRVAAAHASTKHASDADSSREVRRLRIAARIMRPLARHFIITELGVSASVFSGD